MKLKLTIAWLYPDLMSTYGDRGNVMVFKKRCEWRGIDVNIEEVTLETSTKILIESDLVFMGGAQDRQQKLAGEDFVKRKGPVVKEMIEENKPALFVCAAYQAVGHYYQPYQGDRIIGLGIFDLYTIHPGDQAKRLIGNTVAELDSKSEILNPKQYQNLKFKIPNTIVGFENHGGRTYLNQNEKISDQIRPLARVIKGYGNNGEDGYEGAIYKNAVGSYFHGPLLPKNPHIADWLIVKALETKYQHAVNLKQLDDELEWKSHEYLKERSQLS